MGGRVTIIITVECRVTGLGDAVVKMPNTVLAMWGVVVTDSDFAGPGMCANPPVTVTISMPHRTLG